MRPHFVTITVLSIAAAACTAPHIARPQSAPTADVQLKLATLPRVWVAGFATDWKPEFDLNTETVRLVQRGVRTTYAYADGRVLDATVVLIDGRTGEVLSTDKLPSRMRYGVGRFSSALSLFLQMMNAGMGDWFAAIAHGPGGTG